MAATQMSRGSRGSNGAAEYSSSYVAAESRPSYEPAHSIAHLQQQQSTTTAHSI